MSKSQLGQDEKVVSFYNKKENGYFIEIGASDGINLSNTYLLETQYKWKGICVEPIPAIYKQLIINRPNSLCYDNTIYNVSNMIVEFDIAINDELISGISANLDLYKKTVDKNKTTINVKTLSLNDLLDISSSPTFIEYLSLDTEGSEYEILKTFNFKKYTIGLIDVEHNYVEPRRTDIQKLLVSNGYIYMGANKWDDMYKHSSL
uniref:Methyltransferase FkbM domain-containing protein n=1 Tax=viral metagenome TaxID=1070528 RepID=A0A6C0ANZ7_9ZZZZ